MYRIFFYQSEVKMITGTLKKKLTGISCFRTTKIWATGTNRQVGKKVNVKPWCNAIVNLYEIVVHIFYVTGEAQEKG